MKPAALAGLGLIGILALGTAQAQTPTAPEPTPAAPTAPAPRPDGKPAQNRQDGRQDGRHDGRAAAPTDGNASATRPAAPERAATPRRRRPSYAACNRASQRRSLHGGARRRFLIRCRLGYERIQPGQPVRARP